VAHTFDIPRISISENGLIALNPPIEMSRTGSLSTRTAHPIFLRRFLTAMHELDAFRGELENPYLFQSKTDMLQTAPAWTRPLLLRSVSCARPTLYQDRHVRHCGYCVPCLYRRAAFMPAGYDRPRDYAFDAFRSLSALTNSLQADFRALVRFASRVERAGTADMCAIVLSHGYFPPNVAASLGHDATSYAPWIEMIRRWARSFLDTVRDLSSRRTLGLIGLSPRQTRRAT
jgi:hypothetical protein